MDKNIKMTVAYDGSAYHGWAKQKDAVSVQQTLEEALAALFERKVNVCGTSRTDAGVHALGQVANMVVDTPIPLENIKRAVNNILPEDICITGIEEVPLDFDPIGSPVKKHYRYSIYTGRDKPVFNWRTLWHYPRPLNTGKMAEAARLMEGTKDYKSFASAKDCRTDSIRTIFQCSVREETELVIIDVVGNRFMYNMVRNMVGTLVEVGRGRWKPEQMEEIFAAKDRKAAGQLAPPNGLCLVKIYYD
ncbi:tRNA pseudouridine(38-40) synthase TruA [Sedimentisphaera salicampi]|uniref:tRNA pseudouridine(38-40) synthase TruA n=1 Tax=Sedimentisphaera salicampi TaxID=1941349 RepID=UPI000B9AFB99|nr:tRNA pseudouridine(38-40) synthase TruA [Sedimentisphaera salicampi]OXU14775.1 tRNA pseudouridine synthase A [Sedimentisphaera salicampi]